MDNLRTDWRSKLKKKLILGIGNLLMGDEGIGIHIAKHLQKHVDIPDVDIVDGGTGGLHLLEYFMKYDPVIIVDAAADGKNPGSITMLKPKYSSDYPPTLASHDIGLKDLLEAVALLEKKPEIVLFTISIAEFGQVTLELSSEVRSSIQPAAEKVLNFLDSHRTKPK